MKMKAVMMLVVVCGVVSCTMTEAQTISEVWKCEKNDVMMLIMCGRGVQEGEWGGDVCFCGKELKKTEE